MVLDLSNVEFQGDFYSMELPDNRILYLNLVDENVEYINIREEVKKAKINTINVQINTVNYMTGEQTVLPCPNVIGIKTDVMEIRTAYKEYESQQLTKENMKYCELEYYESNQG